MGRRCLGRPDFDAAISEGLLLKPVERGRSSAWTGHERDAVVAALIRGDSQDALRDLVQQLHVERARCRGEAAVQG